MHTGEQHGDLKADMVGGGVILPQTKKIPKMPANHWGAPGGITLLEDLDLGAEPAKLRDGQLLLVRLPNHCTLLWQPWQTSAT